VANAELTEDAFDHGIPFAADVTKEETLAAAVEAARARWGRIVQRLVATRNADPDIVVQDIVCAINLRGTITLTRPHGMRITKSAAACGFSIR